ncbi:MAG: xanthine dehydrogenase family protein molybdopterin-binding subunit, partial [Nitrososphaerales archaeon]
MSKLVGGPVKRKEDARLLLGRGEFLDDISLHRMSHAVFLRSPYGHARIVKIDVSRARNIPGIIDVLTGRDLMKSRPFRGIPTSILPEGSKLPKRYPMALDEVNYVGEPVSLVIAENRYVAEDALEAIVIEYEPRQAIVNVEKAMHAGSAKVHEDFDDNIAYHSTFNTGNPANAFEIADHVLKRRFVIPRIAPIPLENRGIIVDPNSNNGMLNVWLGTQGPHLMRTWYSGYLEISENTLRIIAPDIGGGFGCKMQLYSDEIAIVQASMRIGMPLKWIETRTENLMTTNHGRDQIHYAEIALRDDGKILGLKDKIVADYGAYLHFGTIGNSQTTVSLITGAYDIKDISLEVYGVFTNKMSIDAYRGAGMPEAIYTIERLVDEAAKLLHLDPLDIRRRNFVQPGQFPYTNATGSYYDNGDYEKALNRLISFSAYDKQKNDLLSSPSRRQRLIGIGVASYVQTGGFGPSKILPARMG